MKDLARDLGSRTVHVFRGVENPADPHAISGRAVCGRRLAVACVVRRSDVRRDRLRSCGACARRIVRIVADLERAGGGGTR